MVWKNSSAITFNSQNTFGMFSMCECLSFSALPLPDHRIPIRKTEIPHDWFCGHCVCSLREESKQFFSVTLLSSLLPGLEKQIAGNNRAYIIPCCHTHQQWNSFFVNTATDWNHLDNTTVHTTSVQHFKALVVATQHQQAASAQSLLRYTKPDYWMKQRTFQDHDLSSTDKRICLFISLASSLSTCFI